MYSPISKQLNVIDLFAGCGGLSDGFKKTGYYNTVACVEWDKACCQTLVSRLKNKWGISDAHDRVIRFDMQRAEELIHGWGGDDNYGKGKGLAHITKNYKKIDVIIGGPPCQAYSMAGRVRDQHGMKYDYRNYLFESYLKIVEHYKPDIFVFENVPGILSAKPDGVPITERIKESFNKAGYDIINDIKKYALFNVSDYGVPQARKRIILIGLRKNKFNNSQELLKDFYTNILPSFKSKNSKTVKDALGDLPKFYPEKTALKKNGKQYSHNPIYSKISNHHPRFHNNRDISIFKELALSFHNGSKKYESKEEIKKLYTERTGKKSNVHKYHVIKWNEPSNTIVAHLYKDGLRHIHPDYKQARSITVREAARLQSFDDNFEFLGSMGDQYKMIGNAVPPQFAKILGEALYSFLIKYKKQSNFTKLYGKSLCTQAKCTGIGV